MQTKEEFLQEMRCEKYSTANNVTIALSYIKEAIQEYIKNPHLQGYQLGEASDAVLEILKDFGYTIEKFDGSVFLYILAGDRSRCGWSYSEKYGYINGVIKHSKAYKLIKYALSHEKQFNDVIDRLKQAYRNGDTQIYYLEDDFFNMFGMQEIVAAQEIIMLYGYQIYYDALNKTFNIS